MKANKDLFKWGYFKLNDEIRKAKDKYQAISYITKELKSFNQKSYKQIEIIELANSSQEIYSLLQTYKDYSPLLQVLFLNFSFFMRNLNEILSWLNSKEFKEQYLDTNHPYPPLLNPERLTKESSNPYLSYETISPELAWDLNLPLPRRYRAILPLFGLSGHLALISFIHQCGATMISLSNAGHAKKDYQTAYKTLLNNEFHFLVHINYKHNTQDRKHILSLADAKVPVLILLRDPIERLKHGVNHGGHKARQSVYDIDNSKEAINRITYGGQDKPHLDLLEVESVCTKAQKIFQYYQTIREIRNASFIYYLDMQEIVGKRTFDTMIRLSSRFGFPAPKSEDREFYESKINNQYRYLLPITFEVNEEIKILVEQSIYNTKFIGLNFSPSIIGGFLSNENQLPNHTISILKNNTNIISQLNLDSLGLQIGFFVSAEQWNELQKDKNLMQKVTTKLQDYLFALKEKTQSIEANKVTESQVLDYLREHKKTRQVYKSYFDKEFVHIKANRPDIVESWKYYQEFERMCAEMDKN